MGIVFLGRTKENIGAKELGHEHCSKQQIEMIKRRELALSKVKSWEMGIVS